MEKERMIMAKDGTNRGGARPGAGRKKKALHDRLIEGNPGRRPIQVLEFEEVPDVEGVDMPKPNEMLSALQRDGKPLQAEEIYRTTWKWLVERKCEKLVSPQVLERYAMCAARWIQCEESLTTYGLLGKHPTTGQPVTSPFVSMSANYMNRTNRLWNEIFQIVKENCAAEYAGDSPQEDVMERLLRARMGK